MIKARFGSDFDRVVRKVLPFVTRIPLHPDVLTLIGVGVSALAGLAFGLGHPAWGALVLALSGLFDLIDGVVARAQGRTSRFGAFFDSSMDRASDLVVFAGLAAGAAGRADVGETLLVLWALSGSVMTSYVRARAEAELGAFEVGGMERAERVVVLILGGLTGYVLAALWAIALGSTATAIWRVLEARRRILAREAASSTERPRPAAPGATSEEDSG